MGYRGEDLDLRTSRTWSATSTDLSSGFEGPDAHADGPIWVDETLLACTNHAYDLAVAHRCGEVRLEHLLHALTRVDAAVPELEARGIRVVPLRRDSAVFIASELPADLPDGNIAPHRSPELEDALRLAAANAAHMVRPAGIGDLLQVLLDLRGDIPGSALLLRHLPRTSAPRDYWHAPAPAPTRQPRYGGELHHQPAHDYERPASPYQPRPARRPEPRRAPEYTIMQGMLDRLGEIERSMSERMEAVEAALAGNGAEEMQLDSVHERIDALAAMLRASTEKERSIEGEAAAAAAVHATAALNDRLALLEHSLAEERAERQQTLSNLSADLQALAGALGRDDTGEDGAPGPTVAQRLQLLASDLEQHRVELGASIGDRIADLERELEAHVMRSAETHATESGELASSVSERIADLERRLDAHAAKAEEMHSGYAGDLAEVHEALTKLHVGHQQLMGSMEQWRSNDAGEIHLINARIGAVQEDGVKRLEMLERLCNEMEALSQLALEEREAVEREALPLAKPEPQTTAAAPASKSTAEAAPLAARFAPEATETAASPAKSGETNGTAVAIADEALPASGPGYVLPKRPQHPAFDFRRWLFGTDDWIKASWRKHTARRA